ncbi:putative transmembrane protein [Variibacter gotjawalensis]|uniref:Putative transmembrane protein n=1 Tax=Variibacter gotjawalensis TaxID=1333996 RepID=A0A0S3PVJ6_9BRAD|nr:TIGR02186 family protein [Variibacter gotjawalensis]NIK45745.1 uncharacterized protein (TIGR02186 family) [Variibacter gotjawalensis]RZS47669.1 uncharacterized protein (TIGR02186 family) [Variibacter gotjawalensis]BAT59922.1 putative transmembrane protein [Variibacter gotjawalensis]
MMRLLAAPLALAFVAFAQPAAAERLVLSVSSHRVLITSNFTGDELVLFGTIEQDAGSVGRSGNVALVATVSGPRRTMVVRRKERYAGIWINRRSRQFPEVPSYIAVLTNKPFDQIAAPDVLQRYAIGLNNIVLPQSFRGDVSDIKNDYREAFLRAEVEQGLYREANNAVTFITPGLFRATVPLPSNVTTGDYEISVQLFIGGAMVAREETAFEIVKTGFEQQIGTFARTHGLWYGLATALLALFTGWIGNVVFRRD